MQYMPLYPPAEHVRPYRSREALIPLFSWTLWLQAGREGITVTRHTGTCGQTEVFSLCYPVTPSPIHILLVLGDSAPELVGGGCAPSSQAVQLGAT